MNIKQLISNEGCVFVLVTKKLMSLMISLRRERFNNKAILSIYKFVITSI